jgi:hypothetical protein
VPPARDRNPPRIVIPLMNSAAMQRREWESLSQLKVSYRDGPLGRQARKRFSSGRAPRPRDRVPDIRAYGPPRISAGEGVPPCAAASRYELVRCFEAHEMGGAAGSSGDFVGLCPTKSTLDGTAAVR